MPSTDAAKTGQPRPAGRTTVPKYHQPRLICIPPCPVTSVF